MRTPTLLAVGCLLLAGCGGPASAPGADPVPSSSSVRSSAAPGSPSVPATSAPAGDPAGDPDGDPDGDRATPTRPPLGTVPPAWLGTRPIALDEDGIGIREPTPPVLRDRRFTLPDRLPMLVGDGFRAVVTAVPPDVLARSTWQPACPVAATDLRWVRLTFWGFDDARHTGELLVDGSAADGLVRVFRSLYAARFPLEEMRIASDADLGAHPTGDGNDTGAFTCRPVVGRRVWSQHAYGLAVDVNPFQNPYVDGDRVIPELAGSYVDRSERRPGMIEPDGDVVRAFASIGWTWGGTWSTKLDLQHFSASGG